MRAFNVLLTLLVCLALFAATIEGGLRLMGLGPQPTMHKFDPVLGWSKIPSVQVHRSTGEFDVDFEINALGLRDDPMPTPARAHGSYRVLVLGDSFVLGYTVGREDLFVDLLETWWKAEGRNVEVINAGTEGWSTDQEVAWYLREGRNYQADLVVLCPYENDLYWNAKTSYLRYPKPRFNADGQVERRALLDPGPQPATDRWATTRILAQLSGPRRDTWAIGERKNLEMEWGAYFHEPPAFMNEAYLRTRGALLTLKNTCADFASSLRVVPIPNKACIEEAARKVLEHRVRVDPALWSPDQPVDTVLLLCKELSIPALDARPALRAAAAQGESLYFERDWHFNPRGNREFARFVHDALDKEGVFPAAFAAQRAASLPPPASAGVPGWVKLYFGLLIALSALYAMTYRDEPLWIAPLKVGGMLALVFTIAIGGGKLLALLPPLWRNVFLVMFVGGLLMFILYKLGRRLGTIAELFVAFTRRGHWYLMPLVIVLLTIGSLLVVAASSPLVAPFIYTLF